MILGAAMAVGSIAKGVAGAISAGQASKGLQDAYSVAGQKYSQAVTSGQNQLEPYLTTGKTATGLLNNQLGGLTQGFQPTVAQLDQTPGYQFMQQQGINAINNQMAAQGLAGSGAEMKGLDNFATANALQNYSKLAQIYNQNRQITLQGLLGAQGQGYNAAAQYGNLGMQGANGLAQAAVGSGQAKAAGILAQGKAIGGMISGAASSYAGGMGYGNMLGGMMGGGGGAAMSAQPAASAMGGMGTY